MSIDEQLAALPVPVKEALRELVVVLGRLPQDRRSGLSLALHAATEKRGEGDWVGQVLGVVNRLTATVTVWAMPSRDQIAEAFEQLQQLQDDSAREQNGDGDD